jgi:hypothetical protein
MRGLDPRIHHLRKTLSKGMDCRVKPGNDALFGNRRVGKGAPFAPCPPLQLVGTPSGAHSRDPLPLPTLLSSLSSPRPRAGPAVADQAVEMHADVGGFG